MRLFAFIVTLVLAPLMTTAALACSDWFKQGEVLGLRPDGGWVYLDTSSGGGLNVTGSRIVHYDRNGEVVAARRLCVGEDCQAICGRVIGPASPRCVPPDALTHFVGGAFVVPADDPLRSPAVIAQIRRHMNLTPLVDTMTELAAAPVDESVCAIVTAPHDGLEVPVYGLTVEQMFECSPVTATLFADTPASVEFMRLRYGHGRACRVETDDVVWFPKARRATMRRYVAAATLAPAERVAAYREVVAAEPGFVPARIALYGALLDANIPWRKAKAALGTRWPKRLWAGNIMTFVDGIEMSPDAWAGKSYDTWLDSLPPPQQ